MIEQIQALIRAIFVVILFFLFVLIGSLFFVPDNSSFIFSLDLSRPLLARILLFLNFSRFAVIPILTVAFVIFQAGLFVEEIYGLKIDGLGLRYVLVAMFGIAYPNVRVRRGRLTGMNDNIELLTQIGGPCNLMIQADTAILFQRTRTTSAIETNRGYFMIPFERTDKIVCLEDQEGFRDAIETVTRDGIRIRLTDVRFRYCILPNDLGTRHIRSIEQPYSYSPAAIREITYHASASRDSSEDEWSEMVARTVTGTVIFFINRHTIDFLTAPRRDGRAPREEVNAALNAHARTRFRNVGAQLIWIDVGHIDIIDSAVDNDRVDLWAADWAGNAQARRAFADAARSALRDLGRAEAQAQMIMGITRSLQGIDINSLPRDQLAALILMRTAQLLEGFSQDNQTNQPKDGSR